MLARFRGVRAVGTLPAAAGATRRRRSSRSFRPRSQLTHEPATGSEIVVVATRADGVTAGRDGRRPRSAVANPALARVDGHDALSRRRRRDDACRPSTTVNRRRRRWPVKDAAVDRPDQLQARRDAGLHAVRLQHRQLPRRGPRQGRISTCRCSASIPTATTSG